MNEIIPVLAFLLLVIVWVYPIVRGISVAREKRYSTAWMWFGIHPVSGWIAYLVLKSLPPLKECPRCAEKVKDHARVCAYCLYDYETPAGRSGE